jgi:hypothetical protein
MPESQLGYDWASVKIDQTRSTGAQTIVVDS